MTSILPFAEQRYIKAHDWRFLRKENLPLAIVNGTDTYTLDSGTLGFFMQADAVEAIFSTTNKIYLEKKTLQEMRMSDPGHESGSSTQHPQYFAPVGDNTIKLYPSLFQAETLRVDGMITSSNLFTIASYPVIPVRYQDSFIHYCFALALDRENDERANSKKQEAMAMIKLDIQSDMESIGDAADGPRMKHPNEARVSDMFRNWEWQDS